VIPWCARCGSPAEHSQLSRYELGGVVLVRSWCHGETATARVRIAEIEEAHRAVMFEAPVAPVRPA